MNSYHSIFQVTSMRDNFLIPFKLFLVPVFALLLSSCAIWSNPGAVSKIPDNALTSKDTGIMIMSSGAREACTISTTHAHLFERTTDRPIKSLNINHTSVRSEFDTHHGGVSAFALEPGSYYFFPSRALTPHDLTELDPMMETTSDALAFEIKGGETIYLGELYMPTECSSKAQYIVRDQYERDMAFIRKERPSLLVRAPVKRPLENIGPLTMLCNAYACEPVKR